jgi:hypothetical protein
VAPKPARDAAAIFVVRGAEGLAKHALFVIEDSQVETE